jgi:hypothetical protein
VMCIPFDGGGDGVQVCSVASSIKHQSASCICGGWGPNLLEVVSFAAAPHLQHAHLLYHCVEMLGSPRPDGKHESCLPCYRCY